MKKVLFVINPLAGGTDKSVLTDLINSANDEGRFLSFDLFNNRERR